MYSNVCPNCGNKSGQELKDCPDCGYEKAEIVNKNSISKSINDALVKKLSFLDYPQLYATIIFRLSLLLISIFLIPGFISNSEFFWIIVGVFSVYGLIKEVAKNYTGLIPVYKISKLLLFAYFGAGFGNIISHTGRMVYYRFSYYFNLEFIYHQISKGNSMIIIGAIFGIIAMILFKQFKNEFKHEDISE